MKIKLRIKIWTFRAINRVDMWRKGYKQDEIMAYLINKNQL